MVNWTNFLEIDHGLWWSCVTEIVTWIEENIWIPGLQNMKQNYQTLNCINWLRVAQTLVSTYQSKLNHIPEESNVLSHRWDGPKFHMV